MGEGKGANQFKEQAENLRIERWQTRECSMCNYPLAYEFSYDYSEVRFDAGCYCTGNQTYRPSSWEDVAEHYNIQKNETVIADMNKFWNFE